MLVRMSSRLCSPRLEVSKVSKCVLSKVGEGFVFCSHKPHHPQPYPPATSSTLSFTHARTAAVFATARLCSRFLALVGNWTNVRRKGCWHGEQETGLCLGSRADRKNESRQVRLAEEDVNLFAGHEP
ncbi:uncharacterized protein [Physcomitrium patens]|uniref:Uncharacterized protein n=1 Tax=Physcomitrium patens TaxID=3218 RepID=A0A7I4FNI6_PHYPA|nr:uncharacterized protein LOC112281057 [Physcomitrium patens]|eukprot:XP_024372988.1 uncharacterized protein LOC112281057 [Physcomitrella patens]